MLCSNVDLPTLCSTHDQGGGVLSSSTFIVYTITRLPPSLHSIITNPPQALLELADTIAEKIPIHFTCYTLDGELTAFPCPKTGTGSGRRCREVDQLPWFFLNAAGCSKHAIAGRGSVLETLLTVLQRPWCALELCCAASAEALRVLVAFTSYLTRLGFSAYVAATVLLAHELISRDREEEDDNSVRQVRDPVWLLSSPEDSEGLFAGLGRRIHHSSFCYASLADLRQICVKVFGGSMRSHNGFWLRLVSVVGVELGMRYSRLGLLLSGSGKGVDLLSMSFADHEDVRLKIGSTNHGEEEHKSGWRLRRSVSKVELSSRGPGRGARRIDRWRGGEVEPKEFFVLVYAEVLRRLGDAV